MIKRAVEKQGHLQFYINENQLESDTKKGMPPSDLLDYEDWRVLTEVKDALKPLYS